MLLAVEERPVPSPYLPLERIAEGGMGYVELALRHEGAFERLYALKRLHPHLRRDDAIRRMFTDEARVAGLLRHPNVVSVLDVGDDAEGPFLVMDLVEGVPLSAIVGAYGGRGELLPLQVALAVARDASEGLHAAHELRAHDGGEVALVHRDVSPQNILVSYEGIARVTDFGVAKALGGDSTSLAALKGKVGYMSPEQLRFEELDRRSDLFSLGVVLHEMLTGERLYGGGDLHTTARRILHDPPPDLGEAREDAPPALVELMFDLLSKDRTQRPATALEVSRRLREILSDIEAEEGALQLRDFMQAEFASAHDKARARRTELLRALRDRSSRPPPAPVAAVDPSAATLPDGPAPLVAPRRGRARRAALLSGLLALIAAAVAVGWSLPDPPGHPTPATASAAGEAPEKAPARETVVAAPVPAAEEPTEATTPAAAPIADAPALDPDQPAAVIAPPPRDRRTATTRPREQRRASSGEEGRAESARPGSGSGSGVRSRLWSWP